MHRAAREVLDLQPLFFGRVYSVQIEVIHMHSYQEYVSMIGKARKNLV